MTRERLLRAGTAGNRAKNCVEPESKMPKICAQSEIKVKPVHFCRILVFNCTKKIRKKLAI